MALVVIGLVHWEAFRTVQAMVLPLASGRGQAEHAKVRREPPSLGKLLGTHAAVRRGQPYHLRLVLPQANRALEGEGGRGVGHHLRAAQGGDDLVLAREPDDRAGAEGRPQREEERVSRALLPRAEWDERSEWFRRLHTEHLKADPAAATTPEPGKSAPRIVLPAMPNADPRTSERRRLLGKLMAASGPGAISKIADEFLAAGFTFPDDQEVHLQLLEHLRGQSLAQMALA